MTVKSFHRGHAVIWCTSTNGWLYADKGQSIKDDKRHCGHCGKQGVKDHDYCLGTLPGVANACCGHGDRSRAYIQFTNGLIIRGFTIGENKS